MDELENKLAELVGLASEHKTVVGKLGEEIKTLGEARTETKETLEKIREDLAKVHTQVDAIDASTQERVRQATAEEKTLADMYMDSAVFKDAMEINFRRKEHIHVPFNRSAFQLEEKATITNVGLGAGTSGIAMPAALVSSPLMLPQIGLRIRNLMRVQKLTTGNTYYWLRQTGTRSVASPQIETSPKAESTYGFDTVSDDVITIAHYTKVSKQALSDIPWLRRTIDAELLYGLLTAEEAQILAGSGTGENLNGLITQATARSAAYDVANDTKLDRLRHAMLQVRLAGLATFAPSGVVLHPKDMHDIELIKVEEGGVANKGTYVVGDPKDGPAIKQVWGLPVVESDSIAVGSFLVGAFSTAATLIDRLESSIDISFENEDDFIKNKATIRAEERIGLAVMRPTAFVKGTF